MVPKVAFLQSKRSLGVLHRVPVCVHMGKRFKGKAATEHAQLRRRFMDILS